MFASDNVNSSTCVIRRSIYSLMTRIDTSLNPIIVKSILEGDVYCTSALHVPHCCTICSFYLTQQHLAFVLKLYGHIVHVLLSEIND